jgi:hypothetical protein
MIWRNGGGFKTEACGLLGAMRQSVAGDFCDLNKPHHSLQISPEKTSSLLFIEIWCKFAPLHVLTAMEDLWICAN